MSAFDADILAFITRCIDSVETLDVLLLLRRSPDTFWAPAAVARQLGINAETAANKLAGLHSRGLLARAAATSAFRFAPSETGDNALIGRLETLCHDCRPAVLGVIRSRGGLAGEENGDGVRA
jgi:hypothetical protein